VAGGEERRDILYIHVTDKVRGPRKAACKGRKRRARRQGRAHESKVEIKGANEGWWMRCFFGGARTSWILVAALEGSFGHMGDTETGLRLKDDQNTVRIWVDSKKRGGLKDRKLKLEN